MSNAWFPLISGQLFTLLLDSLSRSASFSARKQGSPEKAHFHSAVCLVHSFTVSLESSNPWFVCCHLSFYFGGSMCSTLCRYSLRTLAHFPLVTLCCVSAETSVGAYHSPWGLCASYISEVPDFQKFSPKCGLAHPWKHSCSHRTLSCFAVSGTNRGEA